MVGRKGKIAVCVWAISRYLYCRRDDGMQTCSVATVGYMCGNLRASSSISSSVSPHGKVTTRELIAYLLLPHQSQAKACFCSNLGHLPQNSSYTFLVIGTCRCSRWVDWMLASVLFSIFVRSSRIDEDDHHLQVHLFLRVSIE